MVAATGKPEVWGRLSEAIGQRRVGARDTVDVGEAGESVAQIAHALRCHDISRDQRKAVVADGECAGQRAQRGRKSRGSRCQADVLQRVDDIGGRGAPRRVLAAKAIVIASLRIPVPPELITKLSADKVVNPQIHFK